MNGKVPNSVSKLPMPDVNESKEPPPNFCMKHDNPVPLVDGSCIVCAEEPKEKEKPMLELEILFELVKNNSCTVTEIVSRHQNLVEFNTTLLRRIEKLEEGQSNFNEHILDLIKRIDVLEERLINAIEHGPKRYYSRRGVDIDANQYYPCHHPS